MKQKIRQAAPGFIKSVYRFLRYRNQRKKVWREVSIRKEQDKLLRENYTADVDKLIVFVVPGADWSTGRDAISGGVMSIVSICEETAALAGLHGAEVMLRHRMFENNTLVYRFDQLHSYFLNLRELMIHIPEFIADHFLTTITKNDKAWFSSISRVQVNVMNQNIRLMPSRDVIDTIRSIFTSVTITTAHQKYCTPGYREQFGVPLHKLSVWISPEQYTFLRWQDKKNLIVVSPDPHPLKDAILQQLREAGLEVRIIHGLTYEEYKQLISTAKWSLTFGEGLDGYFIEPVFSGAVSFATFNEQFFTADFAALETVYSSVDELIKNITNDLSRLDNETSFNSYQQQQFRLCSLYYSKEQYRRNIAAFYQQQYTYA
jgi:hypothetical protein